MGGAINNDKTTFKGLLAISLAVSLHGGEVKEKKPVKPVKEDPQELAAKRVEAFSRFSNVVTEIEKSMWIKSVFLRS